MNKLLALIFILYCCSNAQANELTPLQKAFQQAKKSHRANPIKAIELWQQYKSQVALLPAKVQYDWHKYTVIAALNNANYPLAALELGELIYTEQANNPDNIVTLSNLAGVLFSYIDKAKHAQNAYKCALKQQPSSPLIKARLLHNLALAQLNKQDIADSFAHFQQAIDIANKQKAHDKIALYNANLGYAYLNSAQPDKALPYLRRAIFLNEQHNDLNLKVKTALYLLNTITQLEKWYLYDRYFNSVYKLANGHSEFWAENYFTWTQALAKTLRTKTKLNSAEKQSLLAQLNDEKNIRALNSDYKVMAKKLGITLPTFAITQTLAAINDEPLIEFVNQCVEQTSTN